MYLRVLTAFIFASALCAQQAPEKPLEAAAKAGHQIPAAVDVDDNVSIEAVLLPPDVTRGLFGKSVSDRYVAVQVIVANRHDERTLIIHDIFLDYSRWLLSGTAGDDGDATCDEADRTGKRLPGCANPAQAWQTRTRQSQVASAEYRLPRGTLLDSQPFTVRNFVIRALEAVGSVAAGYVWAWKEPNVARGFAAYNGNFLPAARYFWPDRTIDQVNRISDFGFRVNRVVAKQSAEMMVAFFPIDRFITPGLKKTYLKHGPAMFFTPHTLLMDEVVWQELAPAMTLLGTNRQDLAAAARAATKYAVCKSTGQRDKCSPPTLEQQTDLAILSGMSLNRVRIFASGSMVVDAQGIPAAIEGVEFEGGNRALDLWRAPGVKRGVIRGRNLGGATPIIVNREELKIEPAVRIDQGSTDTELRFTAEFKAPIESGKTLTFRADKLKEGKTVSQSQAYTVVVEYVQQAPEVTSAELSGQTLKIKGSRMYETNRTVTLKSSGKADKKVDTLAKASPTEIEVDVSALKLETSCWTPEVKVVEMAASAPKPFAWRNPIKLDSAKKDGAKIVLKGSDLVDLKDCGDKLTIQLVEDKAGAAPVDPKGLKLNSASEAVMDLPAAPADAKWKVVVKTVSGQSHEIVVN